MLAEENMVKINTLVFFTSCFLLHLMFFLFLSNTHIHTPSHFYFMLWICLECKCWRWIQSRQKDELVVRTYVVCARLSRTCEEKRDEANKCERVWKSVSDALSVCVCVYVCVEDERLWHLCFGFKHDNNTIYLGQRVKKKNKRKGLYENELLH